MLYEKLRNYLGSALASGRRQARLEGGKADVAVDEIPLFPTEEELALYRRARQRRLDARGEACAHGVCA